MNFGGCFENRMRLPKLIIENIRKKTGGTLAVICRINGSDDVVGGQTPQDAAAVASYLEKRMWCRCASCIESSAPA